MQHPEIFLLRHGQTEWNREGRMQGSLDSPLTELGRAQARAQGLALAAAGVDGASIDVFVSPQGRARATAEIVIAQIGGKPIVDARLAEIRVGLFEGRTRAENAASHPHLFEVDGDLDWYRHVPRGEPFEDFVGRAGSFLAELEAPAVVVSHGITSRVMRALMLGRPGEDFGDMPGGQGIVHHCRPGHQSVLAGAA